MGGVNTDFAVVRGRSTPSLMRARPRSPVPNEVLCTDGHANYESIAKDERIPHFALNAGRRTKYTPRIHHTNTVNALISRFTGFTSLSADSG